MGYGSVFERDGQVEIDVCGGDELAYKDGYWQRGAGFKCCYLISDCGCILELDIISDQASSRPPRSLFLTNGLQTQKLRMHGAQGWGLYHRA